jgi:hypothetical protein
MNKGVIVLVIIAAVAAVISAKSAGDVKRYMQMRSM